MKTSFKYKKPPISDVLAPYLDISISDPFETSVIDASGLVDTGYDGELLIPSDLYETLKLEEFEFNQDSVVIAETASGEKLELLSASGAIKVKGLELAIIITIDTHDFCQEILIGRKFLESFNIILYGKKKNIDLELLRSK